MADLAAERNHMQRCSLPPLLGIFHLHHTCPLPKCGASSFAAAARQRHKGLHGRTRCDATTSPWPPPPASSLAGNPARFDPTPPLPPTLPHAWDSPRLHKCGMPPPQRRHPESMPPRCRRVRAGSRLALGSEGYATCFSLCLCSRWQCLTHLSSRCLLSLGILLRYAYILPAVPPLFRLPSQHRSDALPPLPFCSPVLSCPFFPGPVRQRRPTASDEKTRGKKTVRLVTLVRSGSSYRGDGEGGRGRLHVCAGCKRPF